ncbi:hypothetical protein DFH27DRAFT_585687 [Peziza echinospora]|nr:hypothetical protein DFH27DRAFT_585687 [Peziza echinospora]
MNMADIQISFFFPFFSFLQICFEYLFVIHFHYFRILSGQVSVVFLPFFLFLKFAFAFAFAICNLCIITCA